MIADLRAMLTRHDDIVKRAMNTCLHPTERNGRAIPAFFGNEPELITTVNFPGQHWAPVCIYRDRAGEVWCASVMLCSDGVTRWTVGFIREH